MPKSALKSAAIQACLMMSFWTPSQWWYTYPTPVYFAPVYPTPMYSTPVQPTPTPIVACPQIYQPVCGVNGITYGNRCEAEVLSRVPVAHEGVCGSPQPPSPQPPRCHWWWPCPTWPPPGPVPTFGPIPTVPPIGPAWPLTGILPSPHQVMTDPTYPLVYCPPANNPVCGVNGITYESRCVAERMNHAPIAYEGACDNTPRSTINNTTYTNTVPLNPYGTFCSPHLPICIPTLQAG